LKWQGDEEEDVLFELKEKQGYWALEEQAVDSTVWRAGFYIGNGPEINLF